MPKSCFTCSVCKQDQKWNLPAYFADDLVFLLCQTCGRTHNSQLLIQWFQVKEPVGIYCTNCRRELTAGGKTVPVECSSHNITLCASCAGPSVIRTHHESYHNGAKMIWKLYLVESSGPRANVDHGPGVRVGANDEGNAGEQLLLNQMRWANAQLAWSGRLGVSSMPIG